MQKFTPRREKSNWSKRNTLIAIRLENKGLLMPSGKAEIEKAKNDGRWNKAEWIDSTKKSFILIKFKEIFVWK